MKENHQESQPNHYFLLFINSRSGGRKGAKFLSVGKEHIQFRHKHGFKVHLYLYDLFETEDKKRGLSKTKELSDNYENVNVIICGGDGTILWVVSEVMKAKIDPQKICFGIIPIGTGNDFSRSLGWGGSPIKFYKDYLTELKETISKWINAKKEKFDLWDVKIKTYPGGSVNFSSANYLEKKCEQYERTFSNYLGIGIDARVSYKFEEKRTRSKYLNILMYACLGLCLLFQKTPKINNHLAQFSEEDPDYMAESGKNLSEEKNNLELVQESSSESYGQISLKEECKGLVCLNCTSYMSGVTGIFNSSNIASKEKKEKDFSSASFNDGKLEFVSFNNELSLGLERFLHMAGKVTQGGGPYSLKFEELKNSKTYIQIDGEAFNVEMLKEIEIEKSKLTESGQIRVLVHRSV